MNDSLGGTALMRTGVAARKHKQFECEVHGQRAEAFVGNRTFQKSDQHLRKMYEVGGRFAKEHVTGMHTINMLSVMHVILNR